jgi:alpha-D-xyloside xylohydrolase
MLDQKGAVIDLAQRNGEVAIPFLLSSRGYGLLWNCPAVGRVELAATGTRWVADSARQIDYWVTTGSPAAVLGRYADVTGHSPMLPGWASGFWRCKLRYRTQQELLAVAREYKRRGLPLSVIVCDYFHWTHLGDWKFDPAEWPDPAGMVAELASMGVRVGVAFYDATNPEGREFIWGRVRDNYLVPYGIDAWWLDACEPELRPAFQENLRYHAGPGLEVGNMYPARHAQAFYEGMIAEGRTEVVNLVQSAWAGSQRYGAALWSGDIGADFASLRTQVRAGLNVAISGLPWWTTDIGGFHGGDPADPEFRELIVRWFQYGVFCPLSGCTGSASPGRRSGSARPAARTRPGRSGPRRPSTSGRLFSSASGCARTCSSRCGSRRPAACRRCGRCSSISPVTRGAGSARTPSCSARACWSRRSPSTASGTARCTCPPAAGGPTPGPGRSWRAAR